MLYRVIHARSVISQGLGILAMNASNLERRQVAVNKYEILEQFFLAGGYRLLDY